MQAFSPYRPAKAATFDRGAQVERAMRGKIKLAQKMLGIGDDDYRAIIARLVPGKTSSTECNQRELATILDELKAKGFQAQPAKPRVRAADHPAANKARALWISLYHLGAIDSAAEASLEAFARRQLGCDRMQWADQGLMYKLIEALKAMAERHGWSQETAGMRNASQVIRVLKLRLLDALLLKLKAKGYAAEGWDLAGAAMRIVGPIEDGRPISPSSWSFTDLDMIAATFGDLLRTGKRRES